MLSALSRGDRRRTPADRALPGARDRLPVGQRNITHPSARHAVRSRREGCTPMNTGCAVISRDRNDPQERMFNVMKRAIGAGAHRLPYAVSLILVAAMLSGCTLFGGSAQATRQVCDNDICFRLPSDWSSNVVFGGDSASQIIFAPFKLPSDIGHEKRILVVPENDFVVTIFNFASPASSWPTTQRLAVTRRTISATAQGSAGAMIRRSVRFSGLSLGILVEFADREPSAGQLRDVNRVLESAQVSTKGSAASR